MQQSIIRPKQAAALFGVSLSTLWNWNNPKHRLYRPDFPKPFKVSANTTGWLQSEIDGYNATQIAAMFGRRPIDWLRLPETERYIRALCKREAEKQGKPVFANCWHKATA